MLHRNCITPQLESQSEMHYDDRPTYNIINVSGGLQSTAMTLLSLLGVIDRADAGIFADTGWEREATLANIKILTEFAKDYDFPIYTCHGVRSVRDQALNPDYDFINMPVFTVNENGKKGQTKRQCTDHYKIRPIRKKLRELYGPRAKFVQWIGISTDEALRMRDSDVSYIENRYPLIEIGFSRADCAEWLKKNGFTVPSKSSCIGCPFHSNKTWLNLNDQERADAIEVDEAIRHTYKNRTGRVKPKPTRDGQIELLNLEELDAKHDNPDLQAMRNGMKLHLHQSGLPLAEFYENQADAPAELFDPVEPDDPDNNVCGGDCFL